MKNQKNIQIVCAENLDAKTLEQAAKLTEASFGIKKIPDVDIHFMGYVGDEIGCYCAVSKRNIKLGHDILDMMVLGFLTTREQDRGNGIASRLLAFVHKFLQTKIDTGIILNCGEKLVGFYEKNGYTRISEEAVYLRDGGLMTDHDPVMACFFDRIADKTFSSVFFGPDF